MMSMYDQFQTDEQVENHGFWIEYGDFRILLARAGGANMAFRKLLEAKTRPYRRAIQNESMSEVLAQKMMIEVYAETVVLDWETKKADGEFCKGIESETGELLPVNKENIAQTLAKLPDLFSDLKQMANNMVLFRRQVQEEESGNL